jgi:HSP20 family protein
MSQLMRRDPVFGPMDRLFTQFARDPFFSLANGVTNGLTNLIEDEGTLALDVSDDGEAIVVEDSLPGYTRDEVEDNVLTINARHQETTEDKGEENGVRYVRRERRLGSLSRRVTLPAAVDQDKAKATLADGVLTLRLPKTTRDLPKRIAIN